MKRVSSIRHGALWSLMTLLVGCATAPAMKNLSAGQIGCGPDEISISQSNVYGQTASWIAECRGRTYWCSAGGGESISSACKEDTAR